MADFRDGRRSNDHGQMGTSSRGMSDEALDQVVAYFPRLPPPPPQPLQRIDEEDVSRAHRLIEEGDSTERMPPCANCHGAHPKHEFDTPCLEAQQAGYIAKEVDDFKTDRRANDPEGAMQKVAQKLSEADIELLAAYLASLPRLTFSGVAWCGEGL
jgi:cytochrome c553